MNQLSTLRAGATALLPIYPQTLEDVIRLARMARLSGMLKPLKTWGNGKDVFETEDETDARGTMLLMQGMEVGLPPMQAIQLIAMINGRMVVHSDGVPAILLSRGFKIEQAFEGKEFDDNFTAVCTLTRPDGAKHTSRFSVADAKKAGLWSPHPRVTRGGKNREAYEVQNDSPWHKYPRRMLWARALGFASRDHAADAMRGLMVAEEAEDIQRASAAVDITPTASVTEDDFPDPMAKATPKQIATPKGADDDFPDPMAKAAKPSVNAADEQMPMDLGDLPESITAKPSPAAARAMITAEKKLMAEIRANLRGCTSPDAVAELFDLYQEQIESLSEDNRGKVQAMFEKEVA